LQIYADIVVTCITTSEGEFKCNRKQLNLSDCVALCGDVRRRGFEIRLKPLRIFSTTTR